MVCVQLCVLFQALFVCAAESACQRYMLPLSIRALTLFAHNVKSCDWCASAYHVFLKRDGIAFYSCCMTGITLETLWTESHTVGIRDGRGGVLSVEVAKVHSSC